MRVRPLSNESSKASSYSPSDYFKEPKHKRRRKRRKPRKPRALVTRAQCKDLIDYHTKQMDKHAQKIEALELVLKFNFFASSDDSIIAPMNPLALLSSESGSHERSITTRRRKKKRRKNMSDASSTDTMDSTNNPITTRRKKKKRHKEKRESDDSSVVMMDSTNNSRLNKKSKAKRNTNLRLNKKRVKQGDDAENGNNGKRRQNVGAALWLVGDYIDHCYHRANDPKARTKLSLRVSQTQHRSKYITSVLRAMLHQEVVFQKDDMNKQMTMKQWMENKKLDWKTICQKGWKRGVGAAADATCEIVYSALMSGALRAALAT